MSVEGSNVSLRQLFEVGTVAGLTDAQLLQRFLTRRDEAAFEALVRKLGPMVLAVCRRRLSDPNDVDDAFQATFLVLIRRAPEIQDPGRLANWVYGVAHKVAERARVHALRRREHERKVPPMSAEPDPTPEVDDFAAPLHEEIRALPDRYRSAIVVCFLQGRTHEEAARDLGWPVGTVKGRLARAKDLLRKRLVRRGFTAPAGLLASTLAKDAAGSVPPALLHSTIRAALPFVAGEALTAAAVSTSAAALAQEVARTMIRHHVTLLVLGVAALGLIGGGAGVYAWQTSGKGDKPSASDNTNPSQPPVAKDSKPPTPEITNEQRAAAAIEVMDAKSRLARARTKFLLSEYKRLKAYSLRPFYLASWVVQAGDDTTGAKLKDTLTQIKEVGENPADQIAAVKSLLKTIDDYETQAREALPAGANPNLIDFDIDRAEAEVWLAELKAQHPGVQPSPWEAEATASSEPPKSQESPEDEAQNEQIREALRKPIAMPFEDLTPLSDVISYVRASTVNVGLPGGIPIYVAPDTLENWPGEELTLETPSFRSTLEDIPLKTSLQLLLSQRNLAYEVKNGLLSIYYRQSFDPGGNEPVSAEGSEGKAEASMAGGIETPPPDWTQVTGPLYPTASPLYGLDDVTAADKQRTDQARIALNQPTEMPFPEKTPLQDVLNHLRQATVSQTLPCGLPIYLDPIGLENLDLTPESPIRMQLEGVRLKTTLELLLKQLGLVYVVRQGVVIITDPEALVSTPNPREQSEFVQQLRRSGGVIMGGMGGMGTGGMGIGGGMMGGWGGGMGGMGGGMGGSSTSGGFR